MSNLVDHQIANLCTGMGLVEPFNREMVNPASIDVTLGNVFQTEGLICGPQEMRTRWIEQRLEDDEEFKLTPGAFVLAHTREIVRMPTNIEANFQLKSSRGREGINHLLAGYIDPGFHGQITLELVNVNQRHNIFLKPGMRIGQLRFGKLQDFPVRGYAATGRYMHDMGAVPSKG